MERISPKEFLQKRRPKQFSDTIKLQKPIIDRDVLEYQIANINRKNKELAFENFVKELCQKVICPNLLEQTGPVAGGDGKTDTQTFPVSEQSQLLWYEGINGTSHKERWAFAVSTNQNWKEKCKLDVRKIIRTERGYTKIFCVTNQYVKSDQRSNLEDQLRKETGVDVRVLDLSWVLDQIYKNDLINIAISTLNLDVPYSEKNRIGAFDYEKKLQFEKYEQYVNENIDISKINFEEVDMFLDMAIISKELEEPIFKTTGLFERAIKIANNFGTDQQKLNGYYHYAWAAYWWLEDNSLFEENLQKVCDLVQMSTISFKWRDLVTLLTVGVTLKYQKIGNLNYNEILEVTSKKLLEISSDVSRPSNALHAVGLKLILDLLKHTFDKNFEEIDGVFLQLKNMFTKTESLIGFPFNEFFEILSSVDEIYVESEDYEKLMDYLTEQFGIRAGAVGKALSHLKRGENRLYSQKPYSAIQFIGKGLASLNKHETKFQMVDALILLSQAHEQIELNWAARNSLLFASSILFDDYWKEDKLNAHHVLLIKRLAYLELKLGRLDYSLCWYELGLIIQTSLPEPVLLETDIQNYDGCISHYLLNLNYNEISDFIYLPYYLSKLGLFFSEGSLLYILGQSEHLKNEFKIICDDDQRDFMLTVRDSEIGNASKQFLLNKRISTYTTSFSGMVITISTLSISPFLELSETILSMLEGFFATSEQDGFIAQEPYFHIDISHDDGGEFGITHSIYSNKGVVTCDVLITGNINNKLNQKDINLVQRWVTNFIIEFLSKYFFIQDFSEERINKLFSADKNLERILSFDIVYLAVRNILGDNYLEMVKKIAKGDNATESYKIIRKHAWDIGFPKVIKEAECQGESLSMADGSLAQEKLKFLKKDESITHKEIGMTSLIKPNLWDGAGWRGVGFVCIPNNPPMLYLFFENEKKGNMIFQDIYQHIGGAVDTAENLRISIVKNIPGLPRNHYRIMIGENIPEVQSQSKKRLMYISRIHTMTPDTSKNLDMFIQAYEKMQCFYFGVMGIPKDSWKPHSNVIFKKAILIRDALDIGENDLEQATLKNK